MMMKRISFLVFTLAGLMFLASCQDDEVAFRAEVDTFSLVRTNSEGVPQYGQAFYVYGNKAIEVATVLTPSQETIELMKDENFNSTFYLHPTDEDYSGIRPEAGIYQFDILTAGGEEVVLTDDLSSDLVLPVSFTTKTIEANVLNLAWDDQENVDAYNLRIIDNSGEEEKILYGSPLFENSAVMLNTMNISFQGDSPEPGENYIFEIQAYQFEPDIHSDYQYNIQSVSLSRTTLTWE